MMLGLASRIRVACQNLSLGVSAGPLSSDLGCQCCCAWVRGIWTTRHSFLTMAWYSLAAFLQCHGASSLHVTIPAQLPHNGMGSFASFAHFVAEMSFFSVGGASSRQQFCIGKLGILWVTGTCAFLAKTQKLQSPIFSSVFLGVKWHCLPCAHLCTFSHNSLAEYPLPPLLHFRQHRLHPKRSPDDTDDPKTIPKVSKSGQEAVHVSSK